MKTIILLASVALIPVLAVIGGQCLTGEQKNLTLNQTLPNSPIDYDLMGGIHVSPEATMHSYLEMSTYAEIDPAFQDAMLSTDTMPGGLHTIIMVKASALAISRKLNAPENVRLVDSLRQSGYHPASLRELLAIGLYLPAWQMKRTIISYDSSMAGYYPILDTQAGRRRLARIAPAEVRSDFVVPFLKAEPY